LLKNLWQGEIAIDTRTVDTHSSRVRKKLGLDGGSGLVLVVGLRQGLSTGYGANRLTRRQGDKLRIFFPEKPVYPGYLVIMRALSRS
jgi:hypothetical protein